MNGSKQVPDKPLMQLFISQTLRLGLGLALIVAFAGGLLFLYQHGRDPVDRSAFHGEPGDLKSISGSLAEAADGRPSGLIQCAVILLILTPVVRVALSVVLFAVDGDYVYAVFTLVVLGLLALSLPAG
jgi:uncharacterized membrane protein